MNTYEMLAERMISSMDMHKHIPPEPVSSTVRGEMSVLRLLSQENRGMNAGELAASLNMTTSRIAAVLNSLEKKDMILRQCDPDDRRRVQVRLTQKGMNNCIKKRNEAKAHLTELLSHLSEADAASFVRINIQLMNALSQQEQDKEA